MKRLENSINIDLILNTCFHVVIDDISGFFDESRTLTGAAHNIVLPSLHFLPNKCNTPNDDNNEV